MSSRSDSSVDPKLGAAAASAGSASTCSTPGSGATATCAWAANSGAASRSASTVTAASAWAANSGAASAWDVVSMVSGISVAGAAWNASGIAAAVAASGVVRISTAGATSDGATSAASAATATFGAASAAGGPGTATSDGGAASTRTSIDGHAVAAKVGGDASADAMAADSGPTTVRSGNAAGRTSRLRSGAQVRHSPAALFQQLRQVYCRQVMQKLNVRWNASSCCSDAFRSFSSRASAIASEKDASSFATKFFNPRESVRTRPSLRRRAAAASNV